MSAASRHLRHPGEATSPRIEVVGGRAIVATVVLEAGLTLHEAIVRALAPLGIDHAALSFGAMRLDPLVYYLPAIVEGPYLRFWYSDGQKPVGGGELESGHAHLGLRDGAPFVHCHAVWIEADGLVHGGHVVPTESVLAAPVEARVIALPGASILSELDAETEYTLFHPVRTGDAGTDEGPRVLFARVKPNEDICHAVEGACREAGFGGATIRGIGSLIGARFESGEAVEDQGSEILVTGGEVAPGPDGAPLAAIDICFSGFSGLGTRGRLSRGENPVCITFELVIEESPGKGTAS